MGVQFKCDWWENDDKGRIRKVLTERISTQKEKDRLIVFTNTVEINPEDMGGLSEELIRKCLGQKLTSTFRKNLVEVLDNGASSLGKKERKKSVNSAS